MSFDIAQKLKFLVLYSNLCVLRTKLFIFHSFLDYLYNFADKASKTASQLKESVDKKLENVTSILIPSNTYKIFIEINLFFFKYMTYILQNESGTQKKSYPDTDVYRA